jgi:hypothetical protein
MRIRKSSGELVPFDPDKIRAVLRRAGAKPELVERVLAQVTRRVKDGMATRHIDRIVRKELRRASVCVSCRFSLREALQKLGPAGFTFETYIAEILRAEGYAATLPEADVPGASVDHEVDVIAEKDGKRIMIEAKFRNRGTETVNLKDTMATWARFIDLKEGASQGKNAGFTDAWIITNGRFSDRAMRFAEYRGLQAIGWKSKPRSLAEMVDHQALYPVTVLDDVAQWELDRLATHDLVLCRDIAVLPVEKLSSKLDVPASRARKLIMACAEVVEG